MARTLILVQILTLIVLVQTAPSSPSEEGPEPKKAEAFENSQLLDNIHSHRPASPSKDFVDPIELAGLYEGDIILSEGNDLTRNAINEEKFKWFGGVIPYMISPLFNPIEMSLLARVFMEYKSKTCIIFQPRTTENDYINIVKGQGCSSHVGRTGGAQPVVFGEGCVHFGIMIHELMHAVGFWHEQSRWDRDDHVNVFMNNVATGMDANFNKYTWQYIQNLSAPYDTSSVMHYGPHAFAKDRRFHTIQPKVPNPKMGQREGFSEIDLMKINRLYNCPQKTGTPPASTSTVSPLTVTPLAGVKGNRPE